MVIVPVPTLVKLGVLPPPAAACPWNRGSVLALPAMTLTVPGGAEVVPTLAVKLVNFKQPKMKLATPLRAKIEPLVAAQSMVAKGEFDVPVPLLLLNPRRPKLEPQVSVPPKAAVKAGA